jgi:hypothetical protein
VRGRAGGIKLVNAAYNKLIHFVFIFLLTILNQILSANQNQINILI